MYVHRESAPWRTGRRVVLLRVALWAAHCAAAGGKEIAEVSLVEKEVDVASGLPDAGARLAVMIRRLVLDPQNGWFCPLEAAVANLTAEQAGWVPASGLNSIWALVHHIRVEAEVVALRLKGEQVDYALLGAPDGWPEPEDVNEEGWAEACRRALEAHQALADLLEGFSGSELEEPLWAGGPTRRYWVQGLVAHTQYHTGQILLLRRLQSSWEPLQWLPPALL